MPPFAQMLFPSKHRPDDKLKKEKLAGDATDNEGERCRVRSVDGPTLKMQLTGAYH